MTIVLRQQCHPNRTSFPGINGYTRHRAQGPNADAKIKGQWKAQGATTHTHVQEYVCAGVAQLVEHLICNQRVGGSNPSAGSINLQSIQ
jgi:hypothetical protein